MVSIIGRKIFSTRTPTVIALRNFSDSNNSQRNIAPDQLNVSNQNVNQSDTTNASSPKNNEAQHLSGFGRAFAKLSKLVNQPTTEEPDVKFATLLRHSKLMQVYFNT